VLYPSSPDQLRRRRIIGAAAAIVLLMLAATVYVVIRSGPQPQPHAASSSELSQPAPANPSTPAPATVPTLRSEADSTTFVRDVATSLFAWDTTSLTGRDAYLRQLASVADPGGEAVAGLMSDLDTYLPTATAWTTLAQYDTRQWLTIDAVTVPTQWAAALAQAGSALKPGTAALTVEGIRHRAGVWEGAPVSSEHPVAFTVFVVCAPTYPRCHLLRLSVLDKPLP